MSARQQVSLKEGSTTKNLPHPMWSQTLVIVCCLVIVSNHPISPSFFGKHRHWVRFSPKQSAVCTGHRQVAASRLEGFGKLHGVGGFIIICLFKWSPFEGTQHIFTCRYCRSQIASRIFWFNDFLFPRLGTISIDGSFMFS